MKLWMVSGLDIFDLKTNWRSIAFAECASNWVVFIFASALHWIKDLCKFGKQSCVLDNQWICMLLKDICRYFTGLSCRNMPPFQRQLTVQHHFSHCIKTWSIALTVFLFFFFLFGAFLVHSTQATAYLLYSKNKQILSAPYWLHEQNTDITRDSSGKRLVECM